MSRRVAFVVALICICAVALPALGCPVCYGEAEGEVITGTKWSVAFLGGLVYLLLGGVGGLVLIQRRRLRLQTEAPHDDLNRLKLKAGKPANAGSASSLSDPDPSHPDRAD